MTKNTNTHTDWEKDGGSIDFSTTEDANKCSMLISKLSADAEKAYGGCHKCYGKGYSTVRYGHRVSSDFVGDKGYIDPIKTHYHFCECERGKQIQKMLADARREVVEKVKKIRRYKTEAGTYSEAELDKSLAIEFGYNRALDDVLATLKEGGE